MSTAYDLRLEDVQAIAADVWASITRPDDALDGIGEDAGLLTTAAPLPPHTDVVRARVDVRGAWNGQVVLELTAATAHELTATMLDGETFGPLDVADAVGELVNIVGGNIKSLLPAPSTLGLPVVGYDVVADPDAGLALTAGGRAVELCRADLAWAGEALRVSVWTAPDLSSTDHGNDYGTNQGRTP